MKERWNLWKIFQIIFFIGLELKKRRGEGRNQVGEEDEHELLRERVEQPLLNQAYPFVHLDFRYEATTIGKWTSEASFYTQESPQADAR